MANLIYADESYKIIGAAMVVHKELGCGFSEKVYQEALALEFAAQGIPFEREKRLRVSYKGQLLEQDFYADFVCYDKIIVELKALPRLQSDHMAQVMNYLKCTQMRLGLLFNFGQTSLDKQRVIWDTYHSQQQYNPC